MSLTAVVGVVAGIMTAIAPVATAAPAPAAAPWTTQQPALPTVANGEFTDVDCASATSCVAVGGYSRAADATPLVERWNGSTWNLVDVPVPTGYRATASAVSCATRTACVVVGSASTTTGQFAVRPFVSRLAGGSWTSRVLPKPTPDLDGNLADVSCTSATSCLAVGAGIGYADEVTYTVPAAYRLDGSTWSAVTPVQTGSGLLGVSCPTADWCAAVGPARTGSVRQVLTGGAWNVRPLADTGTDDVRLAGIACTAPGDCAAVGGRTTADDDFDVKPAIETSAGGVWTLATIDPTVATSNGSLANVDCSSTTSCTAVGRLGDRSGASEPLALRRGSTWTRQTVTTAGSDLRGVSCPDATSCVAAGSVDGRVDNGESLSVGLPVAVRAAGTAAFADLAAPAPKGFTSGRFTGVSCSTADACTAVGLAEDRQGQPLPFVNRWDGSTWTLQTLPALGVALLAGVSCANDTRCVAVGQTGDDPTATPLLLTWNGTTWTRTAVAGVTTTTHGGFTAVSCRTTTWCVAVGRTAPDDAQPLAARLDGTTWALTPPAPVGAARDVQLSGVSCVNVTACRIVGTATGTDGTARGVDLEWDGSAWNVVGTAPPLGALGCFTATTCESAPPVAGAPQQSPVAYRDLGTWHPETLPNPFPGIGVEVRSIACSRPQICAAVGRASDGMTKGLYVATRTAAGTWQLGSVAATTTLAADEFYGVDCPHVGVCTAVGEGARLPVIAVSPTP